MAAPQLAGDQAQIGQGRFIFADRDADGLVHQVLVHGRSRPASRIFRGYGKSVVFAGTDVEDLKAAGLCALDLADETVAAQKKRLGNKQDGAGVTALHRSTNRSAVPLVGDGEWQSRGLDGHGEIEGIGDVLCNGPWRTKVSMRPWVSIGRGNGINAVDD